MTDDVRDILLTFARQLQEALSERVEAPGPEADTGGCLVKQLPQKLWQQAAQTAISHYPGNAPLMQAAVALSLDPQHIALLTTKYWGPYQRKLTVSFLGRTTSSFRAKIVQHMNAWSSRCGVSFVEALGGMGQVRISLGPGGYWSYLGTDILHIPTSLPTMNLEGFSLNTPDSEYKRVVRHETGHTLGFPHEHMRAELVQRLDPAKTFAWFARYQGWDRTTVQQQVLTPLSDQSIQNRTETDQDSIMCYQLPASITRDGQPIRGGLDIDESDYAFAAKIYPRAAACPEGETPETE